ncbi:MAG TPA: response regulator [Ktedonobacterales bacterium]|nr:response regulator [Ktedonobacterales bacterium]
MQPAWNNGPRIRLMIVDDVPDTTENVQKLLYFERDIQVIATATSGREAIAKAVHLVPDIVLMDINMPDMDGLRAAQVILQQVPTRVVMMSVQAEPEYLQRALLVGARGYLTKPFSSDQLVDTLRSAAQVQVQSPVGQDMGPGHANGNGRGRVADYPAPPPYGSSIAASRTRQQVIAVFSGKGGVGRSVVALNLAMMLRQLTQERVALVDANLQAGDIHVLLNMNTSASIDDLREAVSLDAEIIHHSMAVHESGLMVLRAPQHPESAERFTEDEMKRIMVDLRENFDYLVVDMSTSYSDANLMILDMADQIVLVTTLELTSLNKVTRFFEVAGKLGYPEEKIVLVCNRVHSYYGIKPQQLESQLRHKVAALFPEENQLMVNAVNRGIPFVLFQKNHPATRQFAALAKHLVQRANEEEQAMAAGPAKKGKRGLFKR